VGALLVQVDECKAQRETNPLMHSNQKRYVSHVFDYFDWLIISNLNNKCNSNMLQDFTKCNFYPPVVGPSFPVPPVGGPNKRSSNQRRRPSHTSDSTKVLVM